MTFIEVLILSIVEGITEFLPISSTGHMILASYALGIDKTDGLILFEIVTQLGATLAIVALYSKRLLSDRKTLGMVGLAFIPTGVLGLVLYPYIIPLFTNPMITIVSLIIGGVLLIIFDQWKMRTEIFKSKKLTIPRAIIIGTLQCFAFIPGTSRSAATILAGMGVGLGRREAAEFSFLLAIPTMLAASIYACFKFEGDFSPGLMWDIALGSVISFIVAYFSVKIFMHFIERCGLTFFGIYRILFAGLFYLIFIH